MKKRKWNKAYYVSIIFYMIMAADILINTYVAYRWFQGIPQVHPSIQAGFLVINVFSVPLAFVIGSFFLIVGLVYKKS